MSRKWRAFAIVGVLTILADHITKWWANNYLPVDEFRGYGIPVVVIKNFWEWRLSYNTGSAFGLFHGMAGARIFLTVIGLVALGAIFWMVKQARDEQKWLIGALGLVGGGAIGNLIDRILFGKVTDFIVWRYYEHQWPTFNIADVALCVGVGILFIEINREAKREKALAAANAEEQPSGSQQSQKTAKKPPARRSKKRRK